MPRVFDTVKKGGKLGLPDQRSCSPGSPSSRPSPSRTSPTTSTPRRCGPTARRSRRTTSSTRGTRSPTAPTSTTAPATRTSRASTTAIPKVAVVTFKETYADWKTLFGGGYGIYPAHLLEGKDRNAEMANGYKWSGGPWKIESWNKGADVTLDPQRELLGREAEARQGRLQVHPDTVGRVPGLQGRRGPIDLPAAPARRRRADHGRHRRRQDASSAPTPATSRRCGSTTPRRRSTTRPCARRWPTPSTGTRSSSACSAALGVNEAMQTMNADIVPSSTPTPRPGPSTSSTSTRSTS